MRRISWIVTSILLTLCYAVNAQSQSPASDLAVRLNAELDSFKKDIETLRGPALIKSADLLTGTGLSDPALYSVVESKTKLLMSEHAAKPKDKNVAEELTSVIRALASMSVSSYEILNGLVESSSSGGLRNRAHSLQPKLPWYAKRNEIMQKPDSYQPGQDLMTYRYLNLLSANDNTVRRWGLEELNRRGGAEPIVYAKMRDILATEKSAIQDSLHLDYLAWICKTLSRFDRANSVELLSAIKNDPGKDKNIKKLKKYIK